MSRKLSDADFEDLIQAYVAGESIETVCTRYREIGKGTSDTRLAAELKRRGLFRSTSEAQALRSAHVSEFRAQQRALPKADIAARYLAGETEARIAESFGVGRRAIAVELQRAGIERRTQAETNRLLLSRRDPAEVAASIKKAQDAVRGRVATWDEKARRAEARQRKASHRSQAEIMLEVWLKERGVPVIPQQAVGIYNVDLGAFPVAVEIFGGSWHFSKNHTERSNYIFNQGWNLVIVFVDGRRSVLTQGAADYIAAFLQETTSNPTIGRQYRVIWGEGKLFASGGADGDELTRVVPLRGRHGRGPRN